MKEMKKWKIVALCTVLACLSIVASGTLAYFTAQETAHNVITSGGIDIALIEKADTGDGLVDFEDMDGVMPGAVVSKEVTVKNTGASAAWVRVSVTKTITLANKEVIPNPEVMKLNINTEDWTEQGGYYYYNHSLLPGETTTYLFTTVTFDGKDMGNMYQNSEAKIKVQADAVQVANNGASATVAAGWPKSK